MKRKYQSQAQLRPESKIRSRTKKNVMSNHMQHGKEKFRIKDRRKKKENNQTNMINQRNAFFFFSKHLSFYLNLAGRSNSQNLFLIQRSNLLLPYMWNLESNGLNITLLASNPEIIGSLHECVSFYKQMCIIDKHIRNIRKSVVTLPNCWIFEKNKRKRKD